MNYDFLQSYNIPVARQSTDNQYANTNNSKMEGAYGNYSMQSSQSAAAVNTAYYGYGGANLYNESYQSAGIATGSSGDYYQNPDRYIPPSKHGTGYVPHRTPFKRKINTVAGGGSAAKKEAPIAEVSSDGKLLIFLGRDESYPDELNSLIHPLSCDLCNIKMNSRMIAKDHYESKAHDKHISSWLLKNYTENGINPPLVKRFIKQYTNIPDNLSSKTCDLKLTPLTHEHPCKVNTAVGGVSAAEKQDLIAEATSYEKLNMSLGRDESYPEELNLLIHPLSCDLCNIKMNSRMSAKDHYLSQAHDNHISSWLFKNYTEKGINPPTVKRFLKQGPTGPDAFYCEYCDLKLTSLTHANQHYAGKKHRLVIAQRAKPSGAGFYNSEGKWVRTGTKVIPDQYKDRRFGIGDGHKYAEIIKLAQSVNSAENPPSANTTTTTSAADTTTTTTNESEVKTNTVDTPKTPLTSSSDQDPALFCSVCKVSVTSAVQMTMHLSGSKHMKKLKLAGLNPTPTDSNVESKTAILPPSSITDNVLFSAIKEEIKPDPTDLSMYRTPSGQYYCKTCNTSMPHLPGLEQHLKGKRHLRKQTEDKAMASLAAKKIK
ncbi:zinc finger protein 346-like isoform X1 [Calliphora vicina]|uniref:zinc finger protein 346-like isoform X1 n=1 Tax=Calliphora vicina TaxID=7373 RepID=UPI00325A7414